MSKKVSLKAIVKEIDDALKQLEAGGLGEPYDPKDPKADSKRVLKGVRETVTGLCVPDFEIPG
jgi:hypothetical protein